MLTALCCAPRPCPMSSARSGSKAGAEIGLSAGLAWDFENSSGCPFLEDLSLLKVSDRPLPKRSAEAWTMQQWLSHIWTPPLQILSSTIRSKLLSIKHTACCPVQPPSWDSYQLYCMQVFVITSGTWHDWSLKSYSFKHLNCKCRHLTPSGDCGRHLELKHWILEVLVLLTD